MTNASRSFTAVSYEDIVQAIKNALPGDVITLKNGIWTDVQLEFSGVGTAEQPITLRAETPGEVVFTGASTLTFTGEYLEVDGIFFKEGLQPGKDGTNTVVRFVQDSKFCRLTNAAIVDYKSSDREKSYFWVTIDGANHRVDHCCFKGKDYRGQLLRSMKYSKYNQIDHNYFVDIPPYGINGLEIIQVMGIGSDGEFGSAGGEHVVIEHNLFERADGECEEVISLKSNHDVIRSNTFKESIGGVVIRSGHNTVVEDNFFIGGNVAGTKGIRITGEDNIVSRNYMSGLQGFALSIMAGEFIEHALTDQWQPVLRAGTPLGRVPAYNASKRNIVSENIMINNDGVDLDLGIGYKSGWPTRQRVLLPEENELTNNAIVREKGSFLIHAEQDPSVMDVTFMPNRYENNLVATKAEKAPIPDGIAAYVELSLEKKADGVYQPVRNNNETIGTIPLTGILTENHVGPEWVKRKREQGEAIFQARDQFATVETVPWDAALNVMVLCAGSSDVFVQNMRTKLNVNKRSVGPVEKQGTFLLPVRAVAEKLGLQVTANAGEEEVTIKHADETIIISIRNSRLVKEGHDSALPWVSQLIDGTAFLPADRFAAVLGKSMFQNVHGLIVLSETTPDHAVFGDKSVQEQAFELFKVTASSFEKYMTIPPQGRRHGSVPAHTLSDDPQTQWTAYGDGQWIRYDLGDRYEVGGVGIAFAKGGELQYSFAIEVSGNGMDWENVYSGKSSGVSNELEKFELNAVSARYVRIVGHMNISGNANRYARVQIYTKQGTGLL